MKKFKINGQVVEANSLQDALSWTKSIHDSDELKRLAYQYAELGNWFDRANSAQSRHIFQNGETYQRKISEFYSLALRVYTKLKQENDALRRTSSSREPLDYSKANATETIELLKDGTHALYWTDDKKCQVLSEKINKEMKDYLRLLENAEEAFKRYYAEMKKDSIQDVKTTDLIDLLNRAISSIEQGKNDSAKDYINEVVKSLRFVNTHGYDSVNDSAASNIVKEIKSKYPQVKISQFTKTGSDYHRTILKFSNYPGEGASGFGNDPRTKQYDNWEKFLRYLYIKYTHEKDSDIDISANSITIYDTFKYNDSIENAEEEI